MIAIAKVTDETKFRKDMFKSKRKPVEEIWLGKHIKGITDIVRFAPSACNSQPWIVEHIENKLYVYRYKKPEKRGIMPLLIKFPFIIKLIWEFTYTFLNYAYAMREFYSK